MLGIIGRKLGMTQAFDEDGHRYGVTVIEAGPCVVTQVKTKETDGYDAVQLGFGTLDMNKANKPMGGHLKRASLKNAYRMMREFRVDDASEFSPGQTVTVEIFKPGQIVDVVGTSKGKGFAGTIKRYNFSRGPMSHGSMNKRPPGSVGNSAWPSRIIKGKKMPGQMGNKRVTVPRNKIFDVDAEKNLLFVVGSAPGGRNGIVSVSPAVKARKEGEA